MTIIAASFLVAPLAILSYEQRKEVQLAVICTCIVILSLSTSLLLKVSNMEMIVVSATYAAVLSVFVSNVPSE